METEEKNLITDETITLFVHLPGGQQSKVARVKPDGSLRKALHELGIEVGPDEIVLVGDCSTPLEVEEDVDDQHDGADLDRNVCDHAEGRHVHVHCQPCKAIAVQVNYQSASAHRKFSSARKVADVRKWALHKFKIGKDAAADKLVLEICDSDVRPRSEERLGEISKGNQCEICFSLQQSVAPQG